MKVYFVLVVAIFLAGNLFAQEPQKETMKEAPKSIFVLDINGKEQVLSEGENFMIDPSTSISVKLADFRHFDTGTIAFDYPSNFGFAYEEDLGYKNWTLDGNDFIVFYFEFDGKVEQKEFVNEMLAQFGDGNYKVEATPGKLGDQLKNGTKAIISLFGQIITIDCFEISQSETFSRFIVFQDTRNEPDRSSEEALKTLKMIEGTLKYE